MSFVIDDARYPHIAACRQAHEWLIFLWNLGRAENTLRAYAGALEDHLCFCHGAQLSPETIGRDGIALWVRTLLDGRSQASCTGIEVARSPALANATIQLHIVVARSFYERLVEDGLRTSNPVRKGQPAGESTLPKRGLLARVAKAPWIPNEEAWERLIQSARAEPLRNRLMTAMAYDGALRREELVRIDIDDLEPAYSLIHVRAETTKVRRAREVMYGSVAAQLLVQYMRERNLGIGRTPGPLFRSESLRNKGAPLTLWTWSKVVSGIAQRAGVPRFSTHTFRHLRLTDLARAGWTLEEIAQYAGHRDLQTTLMYIHLSGRELAAKFYRSMDSIHKHRERLFGALIL